MEIVLKKFKLCRISDTIVRVTQYLRFGTGNSLIKDLVQKVWGSIVAVKNIDFQKIHIHPIESVTMCIFHYNRLVTTAITLTYKSITLHSLTKSLQSRTNSLYSQINHYVHLINKSFKQSFSLDLTHNLINVYTIK